LGYFLFEARGLGLTGLQKLANLLYLPLEEGEVARVLSY
jgi:hypothetical protein